MPLRTMLVGAAILSFGGCGDDGQTATVVETVTAAAPAATTPADAEPSTTTPAPATTDEPATTVEPVAGLPPGAVAVQGRFAMKIREVDSDLRVDPRESRFDKGEQRLWFADMSCDGGRCTVRLRRELGDGGYETATLRPTGEDGRSYGRSSKVKVAYCFREQAASGPALKRISLRVARAERRGEQLVATQLDGYFTVKQTCTGFASSSTVGLRGGLSDAG